MGVQELEPMTFPSVALATFWSIMSSRESESESEELLEGSDRSEEGGLKRELSPVFFTSTEVDNNAKIKKWKKVVRNLFFG